MNNFTVREISDEDYVAYVAYETESPMKKESWDRQQLDENGFIIENVVHT